MDERELLLAAESALASFPGSGDLTTVRRVVALLDTALEPHRVVDRRRALGLRADATGMLADRTGDPADLQAAVAAGRACVAALPTDDPRRGPYLSDLSMWIWRSFELSGDVGTLREAVDVGRQACGAGFPFPELQAMAQANLGIALRALHEQTGELDALHAAIEAGRAALAVTEQPGAVSLLGISLRALHEATGDVDAAREALDLARRTLELTADDDPELGGYRTNLTLALVAVSSGTRDVALAREAVEVARRSLAWETRFGPNRGLIASNLGFALRHLAELTGDPAALEQAAAAYRDAVAASPPGYPARARFLSGLGALLLDLQAHPPAQTARSGADLLVEALTAATESVAATTEGHPEGPQRSALLDRAARLLLEHRGVGGLLEAMETRIARTPGSGTALREARALAGLAHRLLVRDDPDRDVPPQLLFSLVNGLNRILASTHDSGDCQLAVETARHAKSVTPPTHPAYSSLMHVLGRNLLSLFDWTRTPETAGEALAAFREAARTVDGSDPVRLELLSELSVALQRRYEVTGDLALLQESITTDQQVLDQLGPDHPQRGWRLANHAIALRMLGGRTSDRADLARAVATAEDAVRLMAARDDPQRRNAHSALGQALYRLGRLDKDQAAIRRAVDNLRTTVELSSADDPHAGAACIDLVQHLRFWFESAGSTSLIEEAVETGYWALAQLPDDSLYRPRVKQELGVILRMAYERGGDSQYLDQAVRLAEEAVNAGAPDDGRQGTRLNDHANALRVLGWRRRDARILRAAVAVAEQAVGATPVGDPHRSTRLSNLAGAQAALGQVAGEPAVQRVAVETAHRAIAATLPGDPDAGMPRNNLSSALRVLFAATGDLRDLHGAIRAARDAVALTEPGHRDRPGFRLSLAGALEELSRAAPDPAVAAETVAVLRDLHADVDAPLEFRIVAARHWGLVALRNGDPPGALAAFEAAVDLLALLAPGSLAQQDRERQLGQVGGLAVDAATAAIAAGRPDRAVELLEETRGLLTAEGIAAWDDLTDLATRDPGLASEVTDLRARLRFPAADVGERRRIMQRWDELLATVRRLPGLESFLTRRPLSALAGPLDGTVVYILAGHDGSHALARLPDGRLTVIDLPQLDLSGAVDRAVAFFGGRVEAQDTLATERQRAAGRTAMSEVLEWLWDVVAEPVLDALGVLREESRRSETSRLWWCPAGTMALLPMHAAGHHRARDGRSVLDRVVSSYTTTLRALQHARRPRVVTSPTATPLVVAMPETPGAPSLPAAEHEARLVARVFPGAVVLRGPAATHADVLAALPRHHVVHFACHAVADLDSPAASHLLVHDHPLTVNALSALRLATSELAFLSACETAQVSPALADEVVHVTSAFQLAGFRQVIGTFWPIDDRTARDIATLFYEALAGEESSSSVTLDGAAASALRDAVRAVRDHHPERPDLWGAHAHSGA